MTNKSVWLYLLAVCLPIGSQVFAYNGRSTVTKQTEGEHGIQFEVSFQEHSLQSPIDATFPAPKEDPQNAELMELLEGIDRNSLSHRFRDRRGPSKPPESNWRLTDRNREKIIAAVKAVDSDEPSIGEPPDWHWDDAEVYFDAEGNYLLWVFYQSRNRGRIWRWVELDSETKVIHLSGYGEG